MSEEATTRKEAEAKSSVDAYTKALFIDTDGVLNTYQFLKQTTAADAEILLKLEGKSSTIENDTFYMRAAGNLSLSIKIEHLSVWKAFFRVMDSNHVKCFLATQRIAWLKDEGRKDRIQVVFNALDNAFGEKRSFLIKADVEAIYDKAVETEKIGELKNNKSKNMLMEIGRGKLDSKETYLLDDTLTLTKVAREGGYQAVDVVWQECTPEDSKQSRPYFMVDAMRQMFGIEKATKEILSMEEGPRSILLPLLIDRLPAVPEHKQAKGGPLTWFSPRKTGLSDVIKAVGKEFQPPKGGFKNQKDFFMFSYKFFRKMAVKVPYDRQAILSKFCDKYSKSLDKSLTSEDKSLTSEKVQGEISIKDCVKILLVAGSHEEFLSIFSKVNAMLKNHLEIEAAVLKASPDVDGVPPSESAPPLSAAAAPASTPTPLGGG